MYRKEIPEPKGMSLFGPLLKVMFHFSFSTKEEIKQFSVNRALINNKQGYPSDYYHKGGRTLPYPGFRKYILSFTLYINRPSSIFKIDMTTVNNKRINDVKPIKSA